MRSTLTLAITMLAVAVLQAQSPITIVSSDLPDEGDAYLFTNASPLIVFDGADTGPDHVWDFGGLTPITQDTSNWIDENDTNPIYFFLWFTSDIAEQSVSNIVNDFITITDVYNFYQLDNSTFAFAGFAGTITGIPFPIGYEDNEVIMNFPADYGQTSNSNTGFNISIPDLGGWIESRDRNNEIDGWGEITTPTGTYDVLRLHSEINITDTFTYDAFVLPVNYITNEYRWLSKETGVPVLQINTQTVLGVETISSVVYFNDYYVSDITSSHSVGDQIAVQQPVTEQLSAAVQVETAGTYRMQVINIQGEVIYTREIYLQAGDNITTMDVSTLPAGYYFVECIGQQASHFSTQFIKTN
jgi:hypothetical protein